MVKITKMNRKYLITGPAGAEEKTRKAPNGIRVHREEGEKV
jgi:hypothetical protein